MKIGVVEDDLTVVSVVKAICKREGHKVDNFFSIEQFLDENSVCDFDLVILDLMLLGKNGEFLVKHLRAERGDDVPILILSALKDMGKKIDLFELGVDDYMTKPFDGRELLARVKALYKRYIDKKKVMNFQIGGVEFNRELNYVIREGKKIFLTKTETNLFAFLLENRGKVLSVEDILFKVWGSKQGYHSNVIQSTVRRLRSKIDKGFSKQLIRNVYGVGYILSIDPN